MCQGVTSPEWMRGFVVSNNENWPLQLIVKRNSAIVMETFCCFVEQQAVSGRKLTDNNDRGALLKIWGKSLKLNQSFNILATFK